MKLFSKLERLLQLLIEQPCPGIEPLEVATEIKKGIEVHKRHYVNDKVLAPNQITLIFSTTDDVTRATYEAWFGREEFLQHLRHYVERERGYVLLAPMTLELAYMGSEEKLSHLKPFRIVFAWGNGTSLPQSGT